MAKAAPPKRSLPKPTPTTTTPSQPPTPPPPPTPQAPVAAIPLLFPQRPAPRHLPRPPLNCHHCNECKQGPSALADHFSQLHAEEDDVEHLEPLSDSLMRYGFIQCGPDCAHGPAEGAKWHRVRHDGFVFGHEKCARFRALATRFKETEALFALARDADTLLAAAPRDDPNSLSGRLQACLHGVVVALANKNCDGAGLAVAKYLPEPPASKAPTPAPTPAAHQESCVQRARKFAEERHTGLAAAALLSNPSFRVTSENEHVVEGLHPKAPTPVPPISLVDLEAAIPFFSQRELRCFLKKKRRSTAPGASKVSIAVIQDLCKSHAAWARAYYVFSRAYAQGVFDGGSPAADKLSATVLALIAKTADPKPGDKPRPIGLGEALISPVRSFAAAKYATLLREHLPHEHGLGVREGALKLFAKVAARLGSNPDAALLSIDSSNAFNSLRRPVILQALREWAPDLLPFFYSAYGTTSTVWYYLATGERRSLQSTCGVTQGDPLGPLFFSLGMAWAIQKWRASGADLDTMLFSFFDDVSVTGGVADLVRAYDGFATALADVGLSANAKKTTLYVQRDLTPEEAALVADRGLAVVRDGVRLLGMPLGSDKFVSDFLMDRYHAWVERLEVLEDGKLARIPRQALFRILRFCFSPAHTHLFRALDPTVTLDFATLVDRDLEAAAFRLAGVEPCTEPHAQRQVQRRLNLPTRFGGCAVGGAQVTGAAAYCAGVAAWASEVHDNLDNLTPAAKAEFLCAEYAGFKAAFDSLVALAESSQAKKAGFVDFSVANTLFPTQATAVADPPVDESGPAPRKSRGGTRSTQGKLSDLAFACLAEAAIQDETEPAMAAVHRSNFKGSTGLPFGFGSDRRAELSDFHFVYLLLLRLGYPLLPVGECPCCKVPYTTGPSLAHASVCRTSKAQGGRTKAHSEAKTDLREMVRAERVPKPPKKTKTQGKAAPVDPKTTLVQVAAGSKSTAVSMAGEPAHPYPRRAGVNDKCVNSDGGFVFADGSKVLFDVTVVGAVQEQVGAAKERVGELESRAERDKVADILRHFVVEEREVLAGFCPFGSTAWGALGDRACGLLKRLAESRVPPAAADADEDGEEPNAAFNAEFSRIKERMVASVCRSWAPKAHQYLLARSLATPALQRRAPRKSASGVDVSG